MRERRIGKFYISNELSKKTEEMDMILEQLKFIPYRVEFLYYMGSFEYIGYSPKFYIVKEEEMIPVYKLIVNKLGDGTIKIEMEKRGY